MEVAKDRRSSILEWGIRRDSLTITSPQLVSMLIPYAFDFPVVPPLSPGGSLEKFTVVPHECSRNSELVRSSKRSESVVGNAAFNHWEHFVQRCQFVDGPL